MKKAKIIVLCGLLVVAASVILSPLSASADSYVYYQPQTKAEAMAYLYGRIAQLMEIKRLMDQGNTMQEAVDQASVGFVTMETHSAIEIIDTEAVLRGEVNVYGEATASAWFEYGQDEDFLDQRTEQTSICGAYDRAIRTRVGNLEGDEKYYFRLVAQDNEGVVTYGSIRGFRTEESDY